MSMRGWFDFARENGGPTVFEKERAPVVYDSQLLAIGATFATIYVAFLFVLLGIRKARLKTFITVTMLTGVGFSILASLYGDGWHVSNAHILAQYRSFCTQQLRQHIHVNIGLNSMNITLQSADESKIIDNIEAAGTFASANEALSARANRLRRSSPRALADSDDNSSSLLLASHPFIPDTIKSSAVNYADEEKINQTQPAVALAREKRLLSLKENSNNAVVITSSSDPSQQLDASEPISSSIQSIFQSDSPASYFMFSHDQANNFIAAETTEVPFRRASKNGTALKGLTNAGDLSGDDAASAITESNVAWAAAEQQQTRPQHTRGGEEQFLHTMLTQQYFYYNERFGWWAVNDITRAYSAALVKGLPYPILTVVEYMSMVGGGLSWGHYYRVAGYYTSALLWAAFGSWLASILLFCIVSRYGAYMCACTGGLMLLVNILYAACVPQTPLMVKFEEGTLTFSMGWCFFLVLATGLVSLAFAALVATMEYFQPHWFSTVLELDYDTPFSYRPINKRLLQRSASTFSMQQQQSSEMYETYEEFRPTRKSYFNHLPQIIRSRIDERRNRNSSAEKQRQKQAARLRTSVSHPALSCVREDATPVLEISNAALDDEHHQHLRSNASAPILSTKSSALFMPDSSDSASTKEAQDLSISESMLNISADNSAVETAETSVASSSRASIDTGGADSVDALSAHGGKDSVSQPNLLSAAGDEKEGSAQNSAGSAQRRPGVLRMRQSSLVTTTTSNIGAVRRPTRISFAHLQFGPNPPPSSTISDLHARLSALSSDNNNKSTETSKGDRNSTTPSSAGTSTASGARDQSIPAQWQPILVDEDSGMEHYKAWEKLMSERAADKRREAQQKALQRRATSTSFSVRPAADDVRFASTLEMTPTTNLGLEAQLSSSSSGGSKWAGLRLATKFAFASRSHSVAPATTDNG